MAKTAAPVRSSHQAGTSVSGFFSARVSIILSDMHESVSLIGEMDNCRMVVGTVAIGNVEFRWLSRSPTTG
jgi:hypothetical protein